LSVASEVVPGDFDGDLDVDGEDLEIWTDNFGAASGGSTSTGDADDDDDVDGADFLIWQRNVDSPASAVAGIAVPEPPSAVLCAIMGLAAGSVSRSRPRHFFSLL
jgi:hypothetical protein